MVIFRDADLLLGVYSGVIYWIQVKQCLTTLLFGERYILQEQG